MARRNRPAMPAGSDPMNRPKRGIIWFVVFFTTFVLVSYLTRQLPKPQGPATGESSTESVSSDSVSSEAESAERPTPVRDDVAATSDNAATDDATNESNASTRGSGETTRAADSPPSSGGDGDDAVDEGYDPPGPEAIGRTVWTSPGGLRYGPGSAEGHRLKHLARHLRDDPSRPVHGVFDDAMPGVLKLIDQAHAWSTAKDRRAVVRQEGDRTVVIATFDRPIGFVGGERGEDDGHPPARKLQLILEDRNVITAYPIR